MKIKIGELTFSGKEDEPNTRDRRLMEFIKDTTPEGCFLHDLVCQESFTDVELFVIRCAAAYSGM